MEYYGYFMFRCKIGRMYLCCHSLILSGVNIKMNIVKTSANIYAHCLERVKPCDT